MAMTVFDSNPSAPSLRPLCSPPSHGSARLAIAGSSVAVTATSPLLSVELSFEVAHHVLDARVVLEPVHRQVLAIARMLEAAVRHLRHQRDVRVDPHAAEVEAARH